MSTISKRKDCVKETWRVQIRKAGRPHFSANFKSYEEAKQWSEKNENEYLSNPNFYKLMNKSIVPLSPEYDVLANHPECKQMFDQFKEIAETYFNESDITPESFTEATQKLYQISLQHANKQANKNEI